jgi:putative peptidoglycan lipid II flippase
VSARRVVGSVVGAATMIAALTVLSRVVGFGRWLGQNYAVGDTAVGDAYATANTLPNVLFEVAAGGALAGAVVPLLAGPLAAHLRGDVDRIASALLTWALAVLTPIAVLVALLAEPIITTLPAAPGATAAELAAQIDVGRYFLVVFAPQIVLYGVGVVLTGVLQAQRLFFLPALAPLLSSVVVIVAYLAFAATAQGLQESPGQLSPSSLRWLAWGTTAGVAAMSLPLLVPVLRSGVRLRPTFRFPPGVAVRARNLAVAGIGALLAQQAAVLVTLVLAKASGPLGTYNVFQYSQAVYFLPYAVLAVPLATAVFPRLSARAQNDRPGYARLAAWSTGAVTAVAVLGAAVLVAVAPAVQVVFAAFGRGGADGMTGALTWMAPGLIGYALVFHVSRALYAVDEGRAAVLATATGWLTVVVASLLAVRVLVPDDGDGPTALVALAVGSSVGMTVAGVLLVVALARVCGGVLPGLGRTTVVALAGAAVGAVVGRVSAATVLDLAGTSVLAAVLAGLLGATVALVSVGGAMVVGDRARVQDWRGAGV